MILLDIKFNQPLPRNARPALDNFTIVEFDGDQRRYYDKQVPIRYAFKNISIGGDDTIYVYRLNSKGTYTELESNCIPLYLLKIIAANV